MRFTILGCTTAFGVIAILDTMYASSLQDMFDFAVDALILILMLGLWFAHSFKQSSETFRERYKTIIPILIVMACVKLASCCDREEPLEQKLDP